MHPGHMQRKLRFPGCSLKWSLISSAVSHTKLHAGLQQRNVHVDVDFSQDSRGGTTRSQPKIKDTFSVQNSSTFEGIRYVH